MDWDYGPQGEVDTAGRGLFVVSEGNFQYGNASLSFYNPETMQVENEVFSRANGMLLGDVAQSMTVRGDDGWIVVNNSNIIFRIDVGTGRETGRLTGVVSPRYMLFVNEHKAYVSRLWDNHIAIMDPTTMTLTGEIEVPGMDRDNGSTEQMVMTGGMVFCTCWSYHNRVIKIDPTTDRVVGSLMVGVQPKSIVADARGHVWVLTDGGFPGNPAGYEQPALVEIDPVAMEIAGRWRFPIDDTPSRLVVNKEGDTLFWLNKEGVYTMEVGATQLPSAPVIASRGSIFYNLTIDPVERDIYVADAIDYQQPGLIYRYSADGVVIDRFRAGVNPGAFAWKEETP